MDKEKAIAIVAKLLRNYPKVTDWFITSDEQSFKDKSQAEAHAAFIKDNIVIAVATKDVAKDVAKDIKKAN